MCQVWIYTSFTVLYYKLLNVFTGHFIINKNIQKICLLKYFSKYIHINFLTICFGNFLIYISLKIHFEHIYFGIWRLKIYFQFHWKSLLKYMYSIQVIWTIYCKFWTSTVPSHHLLLSKKNIYIHIYIYIYIYIWETVLLLFHFFWKTLWRTSQFTK